MDLVARDGSKVASRPFSIRVAANAVPHAPADASVPLVRLTVRPPVMPASGGTLTLSWSAQNAEAARLQPPVPSHLRLMAGRATVAWSG